jgi:hypothetical protein
MTEGLNAAVRYRYLQLPLTEGKIKVGNAAVPPNGNLRSLRE